MQSADINHNRSLVVFYSYFRVILAILLFVIAVVDSGIGISGNYESDYFSLVCFTYLMASIIQSAVSFIRHFKVPDSWILFAIGLDIMTTLTLIHISGGLATGFAILLITPICIAAIFFKGSLATSFAAIASIGILGDSIYYDVVSDSDNSHLVPAGMFGIIFFAASLCVQYLSDRIRSAQSQANSFQQKAHVMAELNQHIVQRIRTGVIVFDKSDSPILFNQAAESLLAPLCDDMSACIPLIELLHDWRQDTGKNHNIIKPKEKGSDIKVNFSLIDHSHVITFIEDMTEISQQALQLKLASLGRLSASIAHEIRNPLSAISHSVQLLEESEQISTDDQYLLGIAKNHCRRINEIISNIQSMSQRRGYQPERLDLIDFCQQIKAEYLARPTPPNVDIESCGRHLQAPFDPTQLHQILTNLIDNALRYSYKKTGSHWAKIQLFLDDNTDSCILRILDSGDGVALTDQDKLFEPFFTSETTGTGLGLYISRELCTLNQSQLTYCHEENSHYFQICFAHANRDIVVKNNNKSMENIELG